MENYAADTSSGSTFLYSKKFLAFTKMDERNWDIFVLIATCVEGITKIWRTKRTQNSYF